MDGTANLVVAANHWVELALLGPLGQVDGVFFQGLALVFGIRIVHRLSAPQIGDGFFQLIAGQAGFFQHVAQNAPVFQCGQHENFTGDVLVAALLRQLVGQVQQAGQFVGNLHIPAGAFHFGEAVQSLPQSIAQVGDIDPGL